MHLFGDTLNYVLCAHEGGFGFFFCLFLSNSITNFRMVTGDGGGGGGGGALFPYS